MSGRESLDDPTIMVKECREVRDYAVLVLIHFWGYSSVSR